MASLNLMSKEERAKHEARERAEDAARSQPTAKEQLDHLSRVERTTGRSGAVPRTPKQMMLDVTDVTAKHPERHFRWVNTGNTDKAMNSTLNGYEQFKDEKGDVIARGNMQLWSCPKEMYEERVAERQARTDASLGVDDKGRRRDSAEFYHEADKVVEMVRERGHRASSPDHIIKQDLNGVTL